MRQRIRHSRFGTSGFHAAWLVAILLGMLPLPVLAQQVTTTAVQDLSCLGTRAGQTLGCNAGDLTATAVLSAAEGTPSFCQAGQSFTFDADVTINKQAANTRYDIGFFTGQRGNDPTVADASQTCSVATFPFDAPFSNQESTVAGDTCGDVSGSMNYTPQVRNIKVLCTSALPTTSELSVPFSLSWQASTSFTCTGPGSVDFDMPGDGAVYTDNKSKCSTGTAKVSVDTQPLRVAGYVDVSKQTTPDGDGQAFSYTATGAPGSYVGYQLLDVSGVPAGSVVSNNSNTVGFTLADGAGVRVFMSVVASSRALTITESATTHWSGTAAISCAAVTGSPGLAVNNGSRTITANLDSGNNAAACTVVNTKRARVSPIEVVQGRLFAADQFSLAVVGAGSAQLTSDTSGALLDANQVAVATSGTATGAFTNPAHPSFRASPGLLLGLSSSMAAGSISSAASYDTRLTCSNAFTGPGATTGLPVDAPLSTYAFTPAPGDDITCTFSHVPKALLTLAKVVVNDNGQSAAAADWTLRATGPATISGSSGSAAVTGVPVPVGSYTLDESGPAGYALASLACTGGADPDPSDGLVLASGDIVTCTFTNDDQQVVQSVVKAGVLEQDADGSGAVSEGDTLRYTVTVTNTGLLPLSNVVVSDPLLSPASTTCPSVAVGASCVLSGTYVVTAADAAAGEVANTASAGSSEIPGPTPSNTVVMPVQAAVPGELAVIKSHSGVFAAGSNAGYTLLVSNIGNTAVAGTTTVEDLLPAGLGFVSATGTGWTCGAAGQLVSCTSNDSVPAYGDLPPITLVVAVDGSVGNSVDNTASVGNSSVAGGAMSAGNTDTATVLHPDLSTSTKAVVDLDGGDVEAGDVLEYRVNLVESAGVVAANVSVVDVLQAGLGNLTVTQVPGGGSDQSSAGQVDVTGITVPANGSVQLRFQVTVGPGFAAGDLIDNTAIIDNPGGPDAAPRARTLVFEQSRVGASGNKVLYLHDDLVLDRTPQAGTTTAGVLVEAGTSESWVLTPVVPPGETLVLSAGSIGIDLPVNTAFDTVALQAQLFYRPPAGADALIGSSLTQTFSTANKVEARAFVVTLASDYTLGPGGTLVLRVANGANGNKHARIHEFNGTAATIGFDTSTVVRVDSVEAYAQGFADGNAQQAYYVHGDPVWIRAVASDPFGGADVSAAELTLTDPYGNLIVGPTPMAVVDTDDAATGGSRTFEYATTVPALSNIGTWIATVTAHEGTEGTVWHTATGQLEVRGRVTLQNAWGPGSIAGDSVSLQVIGGDDAVDGTSTAPSTTTAATASATATAPLTLAEAFTAGTPGRYTVSLGCVRNGDGAAVAVTGTGLSRQVQMPLNSSITCSWNNAVTVPLTVVKLVLVHSDPVNGTIDPKAIPGAIVEYRVIVANPGGPVDSDSLVFTDPVPARTEFQVADISGVGSGSGPVRFSDSPSLPSGLSYSYPADIVFSNDNGATWDYVPSDSDADGYDPAVTDIRIRPKGTFNGNNAQFTLGFRVRIK